MAEFSQFTITDAAFDAAIRFVNEKWFDTANEAGIFAAAYTIRRHFPDVDPGTLRYSGATHNYGYSSFDADGSWENVIRCLYNTETPRAYFRNLIIWGLEDMGKQIQENGALQIADFL